MSVGKVGRRAGHGRTGHRRPGRRPTTTPGAPPGIGRRSGRSAAGGSRPTGRRPRRRRPSAPAPGARISHAPDLLPAHRASRTGEETGESAAPSPAACLTHGRRSAPAGCMSSCPRGGRHEREASVRRDPASLNAAGDSAAEPAWKVKRREAPGARAADPPLARQRRSQRVRMANCQTHDPLLPCVMREIIADPGR